MGKGKDKPRPPCNTCGKDATCVVEVTAMDLELRQDDNRYGAEKGFRWAPTYEHRAHVRTRLCESCFAMAFNAKIEIDATVQGHGKD